MSNKTKTPIFTSREIECMTQLLQNKSIDEISATLNLRRMTIYFYVNSVKMKLEEITGKISKPTQALHLE